MKRMSLIRIPHLSYVDMLKYIYILYHGRKVGPEHLVPTPQILRKFKQVVRVRSA
jgi:hypothetical protein